MMFWYLPLRSYEAKQQLSVPPTVAIVGAQLGILLAVTELFDGRCWTSQAVTVPVVRCMSLLATGHWLITLLIHYCRVAIIN